MNWNDLIIGADEGDFPELLNREWSWLLKTPHQPVYMTALGDWFVADSSQRIFFLDLLEGALSPAAASFNELGELMKDSAKRDTWFLPGFVESMQRRGVARGRGQCYAYKIHPILGGQVSSENLMLLSIRVWQTLASQIHRQVSAMPPGTRVRGMESGENGTIRLITE